MAETYRHTQVGTALRLAILPGVVGTVAAGAIAHQLVLLAPLALALGALGWWFGSLTVEVTREALSWYFGPGLWQKSVARTDIASATPETNPWWWGWGIHLTPRGWLYNVAGRHAVEVTLHNGKRFRLGTDEPSRLAGILHPGSGAGRFGSTG